MMRAAHGPEEEREELQWREASNAVHASRGVARGRKDSEGRAEEIEEDKPEQVMRYEMGHSTNDTSLMEGNVIGIRSDREEGYGEVLRQDQSR
jgi:hypothetical protein